MKAQVVQDVEVVAGFGERTSTCAQRRFRSGSVQCRFGQILAVLIRFMIVTLRLVIVVALAMTYCLSTVLATALRSLEQMETRER